MTQPVFIIAEAGVNHDGEPDKAFALVEGAARAGADAVKFQTFAAAELVAAGAPKADYQKRGDGEAGDQLAMLQRLELDRDTHKALAKRCLELGIEFMSTPFDRASLDFLASEIGLRRVKVPSGEITNGPLLLHAARSGLPIVLSTGMSTLEEVREALAVLSFGLVAGPDTPASRAAFDAMLVNPRARKLLAERVTLLHCTSAYPAPESETNLRAMQTLAATFDLPAGLSDHSEGLAVPLAAVALGAVMIEKHFTLDRSAPGPDHAASLEPDRLADMIQGIRAVESALGSGAKQPGPSELANRPVARRSLVALAPIQAGEPFTAENLGARRPGTGLSPMLYWELLGQRSARSYQTGEAIRL